LYQYDSLNRLDLLRHYLDANSDGIYTPQELNRIRQLKTRGTNSETTTYQYDANDRLLASTLTHRANNIITHTESMLFGYNKTQQTSRITTGLSVTTTQTMSYNLQGKLASVTIAKSNEPTITQTRYGYGDQSKGQYSPNPMFIGQPRALGGEHLDFPMKKYVPNFNPYLS
jgi:YD repeat-containing protein